MVRFLGRHISSLRCVMNGSLDDFLASGGGSALLSSGDQSDSSGGGGDQTTGGFDLGQAIQNFLTDVGSGIGNFLSGISAPATGEINFLVVAILVGLLLLVFIIAENAEAIGKFLKLNLFV